MKQMVECFARVILTNNQLKGRGAYPESRRACLEQLQHFVSVKQEKIRARPININEVFLDLIRAFGERLWGQCVSLKDLLLTQSNHNLPTYRGHCAVCLGEIELTQACKLPCDHSFHHACVQALQTCPCCREEVTSIWSFIEYFPSV